MAKGEVLGYIDCPTCGFVSGMRITHDKNGEPFGFCTGSCNQQMRVGGSADRVAKFVRRYPWAGEQKGGEGGTPAAPEPVAAPAVAEPEKTTKPLPPVGSKKAGSLWDQLYGKKGAENEK